MNVAGAALATILAQLVSVVMSLAIIKNSSFRFIFPKDICFTSEIRNFLKVGFPIALQEFLTNISFFDPVCDHQRNGIRGIFRLWNCTEGSIVYHADPILTDAVHVSFCGTECRSRKRGPGKKSNAYRNVVRSHDRNLCIGTQFFSEAIFHPHSLQGNQAFIARSAEYLKGFAPEAILTCLVFSYIGYFNGHGKTIPVMVQGISASFLVRVPLSYLFSIQKGATLTTIGYAVPLASVYGIIFFYNMLSGIF